MDGYLGIISTFLEYICLAQGHNMAPQVRIEPPPSRLLLSQYAILSSFINIHDYASEIIFIYDHWMKGMVKMYQW